MKGLYDIHCHILPGVDDGARNTEESLWMLNKEYNEGVRHVILTPHFRYDMFEPHLNIVTRQFMQLLQEEPYLLLAASRSSTPFCQP
jgi:protein-tyrosine phosphatase